MQCSVTCDMLLLLLLPSGLRLWLPDIDFVGWDFCQTLLRASYGCQNSPLMDVGCCQTTLVHDALFYALLDLLSLHFCWYLMLAGVVPVGCCHAFCAGLSCPVCVGE